jgi:hypothetical protein
MKTLLITLFSFLLYINAMAQNAATTVWTDAFGLQDTVLKTPTIIDNFGNLYVVGSTINGSSGPDIVIKKYNNIGDPIFGLTYSSAGYNRDQATTIAIDNNYNLIVGGFSYVNATNSYDFLVLKYDSIGTLLWTYTYNGTGSGADLVSAIALDSLNIYITGASVGISSLFDFTTIKLNGAGNVIWNNRYNYLGADLPFDIDIIDTNIYVNGGSQSTITNWDYALLHYSVNGTPIDTIRTTGTGVGFDRATQAVTDNQGYIYITGTYATTSNGLDYKTIKFDQQGNVKWIATFDNTAHQDDIANAIAVDYDGNVYVTGKTFNSLGNYDYCTIKYDSIGTTQWTRYYDNKYYDEATSITVDGNSNVYVTGSSNNIANKDFTTIGYGTTGDTLWTKRFNGGYNGNDEATSIIEENGFVYITGQTQINSTQYKNVTIAYGQAKIKEIPDLLGEEKSANLFYIPNDGQLANDSGSVATEVLFYVPNHNPALYVKNKGLSYVFSKFKNDSISNDTIHRIDMQFFKGNNIIRTSVYPNNEISNHYNNYYLAHCPNGVIDVQGSTMLMAQSLYEGIDLYYSSNKTGEKHYWVLAPNANPKSIKIKFDGADSVSHPMGNYTIHSSIGSIVYDSLVAYEIDALGNIIIGTSQPLQFLHDTTNNTYTFKTFTYNASNALVIMANQKVNATPPQNNYNINWCTYWGKDADDSFTNLTHDNDNNVIYCGNTTSEYFPPAVGMNLPDSTSNNGLSDAVIIKINDIMEPQWLTFMGGSKDDKANSIAAKSNGNLVCVGSSHSDNLPLITPSGAYVDSITDTSVESWLMTEFSKNGYLLWSSPFTAAKQAKDVAIAQIGKGEVVFIVGEAYHGADTIGVAGATTYPSWNGGNYKHSYMMRLEDIGERTWATFLGGKYGSANAIAINDFNQMYVAGYFQDSDPGIMLTPDSLPPSWNPNTNVYVWMYDVGTLQLKFSDFWGTDADEMLNDIAVDNLGNSFAVGSAHDDIVGVNFNPSDTLDFMDPDVFGDRDGMIVRHDSSGVRKWFTYFGDVGFDEVKTAIVDSDNNLYVAGLVEYDGFYTPYQQPPNFYVQPTINDLNAGFKDSYIARFNTNCELQWSTYFGTKYEDANDQINSLMMCNQRLYFCGFVDGGGYDSLLIPVHNFDWNSSNDYYQPISYSPFTGTEAFAGCFDTLFVSGLSKIQKNKDPKLLLFPNPANEQISIKLTSNVNELATIAVFDSKGELVLINQMQLQIGINNFRINTSKLNAGLYFVSVNSNQTHENTKFIKQ